MPILLLIAGLFLPRVVAVILFLFNPAWFSRAFDSIIFPILGFIFLPYSMLWYSVVMNWYGGTWGVLQIIVMAIALVFDLSSYSSFSRRRVVETA